MLVRGKFRWASSAEIYPYRSSPYMLPLQSNPRAGAIWIERRLGIGLPKLYVVARNWVKEGSDEDIDQKAPCPLTRSVRDTNPLSDCFSSLLWCDARGFVRVSSRAERERSLIVLTWTIRIGTKQNTGDRK